MHVKLSEYMIEKFDDHEFVRPFPLQKRHIHCPVCSLPIYFMEHAYMTDQVFCSEKCSNFYENFVSDK